MRYGRQTAFFPFLSRRANLFFLKRDIMVMAGPNIRDAAPEIIFDLPSKH